MARPRKMTTEQMIAVVDSYYVSHAQNNVKCLKCSLIADYAVELGYNAKGYDFARNLEVREYIEQLKCAAEVNEENDRRKKIGSSYKSLDVYEFLNTNREYSKLVKALMELDSYWKGIYENAVSIVDTNRNLTKDNTTLNATIKDLKKQLSDIQCDITQVSLKNNDLIIENRYLKKMLRTYLYPAVANEILLRENVIKDIDSKVTDKVRDDIIEANSPQPLNKAISNDALLQSEEEKLLQKMWGLCDE